MNVEPHDPFPSSGTHSIATLVYCVCDAVPATEEMKRRPRYGRPADRFSDSESNEDLPDDKEKPDTTNDDPRNQDR